MPFSNGKNIRLNHIHYHNTVTILMVPKRFLMVRKKKGTLRFWENLDKFKYIGGHNNTFQL